MLKVPTQEMMSQFISDFNTRFLNSHERHFRKYLASGRLLAALVSTSMLADVYNENPRLNNSRQFTIWTIPGLTDDKEKQLKRFYNQLMG